MDMLEPGHESREPAPAIARDDSVFVDGLLVAVTLRGVVLPELNGRPTRVLSLDDLVWLQQLAARGAHVAPSQNGHGDEPDLADDLRARGQLRPGLPAAPARELEPVAANGAEPAPRLDDHFILTTPVILRLARGGFEHLADDGRVLARLDAVELSAAVDFRTSVTGREALERHRAQAGPARLDDGAYLRLLRGLLAAGLLQRVDVGDSAQIRALSREDRDIRRALARQKLLTDVMARAMAEHDARERERQARTGVARPRVVPVHFQWKITPLALGMILAYAKQYEGGRLDDFYDFQPDFLTDPTRVGASGGRRSIYLFSHYIWSRAENLQLSARLKAEDPTCITIHGGPDVPKYDEDVEAYFRANPHVDVAVRGEGEITAAEALAALTETLGRGGRPDLGALEGVAGLAFRLGDRVVRTADRPRLDDLDQLPSPFLTGLFDSFGAASAEAAVIESNRGCPYGCTFCDWGSATAQRIRKFSLERVFAEIEWCGRNHIETIGLADANFGVFERDVAIAEQVAAVKRQYGYPRHFGVNYAKNSIKYLKPIVKVLSDAGTLAFGQLSLQSTDAGTLETIKRSNIRTEKYDDLAQEFRRAGLPLFIDLMMGLPGSTLTSFSADLQQAIDREVIAKVYPTQLLVNSPMNEPNYRQRHGITATPGTYVTAAASFTRDDYTRMQQVRRVFLLLEKFGVLRHVARYARHETGVPEMAFYERLWDEAQAARDRWPVLAFTFEAIPNLMVPPLRWQLLLDEARRFVVERLGVRDDSALDTVFAVQLALLPARNRRFPHRVELAHDYVAWHHAMIAAKDDGHLHDWPAAVGPLREYGPGSLVVQDPFDLCIFAIGHSIESDSFGAWELDSPLSRPVVPMHTALE